MPSTGVGLQLCWPEGGGTLPSLTAGPGTWRRLTAVELQGESELRDRPVTRFQRFRTVAAEVVVGALQIGLRALELVIALRISGCRSGATAFLTGTACCAATG